MKNPDWEKIAIQRELDLQKLQNQWEQIVEITEWRNDNIKDNWQHNHPSARTMEAIMNILKINLEYAKQQRDGQKEHKKIFWVLVVIAVLSFLSFAPA